MTLLRKSTVFRPSYRFLVTAPIFAVLTLLTSICHAQSPIVQIEEDWEMVIAVPDLNSNGPQLACTFSPVCNLNSIYATFELNHSSAPAFSAGGLHLHVWNGEERVVSKAFPDAKQLSTAGESLTWTQRMRIRDHKLLIAIVNGRSATWGNFGDAASLTTPGIGRMDSLDNYTPVVSMENSGVTYASNCVERLVLKRVRAKRADGTVTTVELNHVVHANASAN